MKDLAADQFEAVMDEVTMKVLNELIDRKQEEKRWKSSITRTAFFLLVMFSALLAYFFLFKQGHNVTDTLFGFREKLFSDPAFVVLSLGLLAGLVRLQFVSKEHEEADDDFEDLRCEFIERCEDFFSDQEQWRSRHLVFDYFQKEYDINLFHK